MIQMLNLLRRKDTFQAAPAHTLYLIKHSLLLVRSESLLAVVGAIKELKGTVCGRLPCMKLNAERIDSVGSLQVAASSKHIVSILEMEGVNVESPRQATVQQ